MIEVIRRYNVNGMLDSAKSSFATPHTHTQYLTSTIHGGLQYGKYGVLHSELVGGRGYPVSPLCLDIACGNLVGEVAQVGGAKVLCRNVLLGNTGSWPCSF